MSIDNDGLTDLAAVFHDRDWTEREGIAELWKAVDTLQRSINEIQATLNQWETAGAKFAEAASKNPMLASIGLTF